MYQQFGRKSRPKILEDFEKAIVYDAELNSISPKARYWLLRNAYRERFNMTSTEMDDEPYEEFMINQQIWNYQDKRQKLQEKRSEQDSLRYNKDRG